MHFCLILWPSKQRIKITGYVDW